MTALLLTVLLASLVGSLHCAGMCGAFVAFSVAGTAGRPLAHLAVQAAYHGGRLVTYALLGVAAGLLGAALDLGGAFFGIQRAALGIAGLSMVLFGGAALLRIGGVRVRGLAVPRFVQSALQRGHAAARDLPPHVRALVIGMLSTFLPCGWLYAFVVTAAGTGSATLGALTMAAFWAGTVPVLAVLGIGVRGLAGPLRRHAPVIAALALVVVGLAAIAGRFRVPPLDAAVSLRDRPAATLEETAERVRALEGGHEGCAKPTEP